MSVSKYYIRFSGTARSFSNDFDATILIANASSCFFSSVTKILSVKPRDEIGSRNLGESAMQKIRFSG